MDVWLRELLGVFADLVIGLVNYEMIITVARTS